MAINISPRMSVAEYLAWEAGNELKHEYIDGEIYDMSGGTRNHSRIMINATIAIGRQLDDTSCRLHSSEMRVKISESRYVYPDLSAICGTESMEDDSELTLLNPVLVVEVTSPSSMIYDRVDKLDFYFDVPSIEAYLIVDQNRIRADLCSRAEEGWLVRVFNSPEDVIPLTTLNCDLPLAQVYQGIIFEEA